MATSTRRIKRFFDVAARDFALEAASSEKGFSIFAPLVFGLYIFGVGFLFESKDINGISFHVLDFAVLVAAVSFFLLVKILSRKFKGNQFLLNLTTWITTGVVGVLVPPVLVWLISGEVSQELVNQIPTGLVAYPMLSVILSVTLSGALVSTSKMASLRKVERELENQRKKLVQEIEALRLETISEVDRELASAIDGLKRDGQSAKEVSDNLFRAIEDVIRPLSHRLAGMDEKSDFPPTKITKVVKPTGTLKRVRFSRIVNPGDFLVGCVIFVFQAAFIFEGLPGLGLAVALTASIAALFYLIKNSAISFELPRTLAIMLLAVVAAAIGSIFYLVFPSVNSVGVSSGFVAIATVSGITMSLITRRTQIIEDLEFANSETQVVVDILRQETWVLKTQLAKAIHGQIQAKFLAAALKLGNKQTVSKKMLEDLRTQLRDSLESVSVIMTEKGDQNLEVQLKTIADSWERVVQIELKAGHEVIKLVDEHPLTRTCLIELMGEAVSNSAKHSKSPKITLELTASDYGPLEVLIISEGRLSKIDNTRSGYGSRILNEVTSAWSLASDKGRVFLSATIQFAK